MRIRSPCSPNPHARGWSSHSLPRSHRSRGPQRDEQVRRPPHRAQGGALHHHAPFRPPHDRLTHHTRAAQVEEDLRARLLQFRVDASNANVLNDLHLTDKIAKKVVEKFPDDPQLKGKDVLTAHAHTQGSSTEPAQPRAPLVRQEIDNFTRSAGELMEAWEPMYTLLGQLAEFRLEGLRLLSEMPLVEHAANPVRRDRPTYPPGGSQGSARSYAPQSAAAAAAWRLALASAARLRPLLRERASHRQELSRELVKLSLEVNPAAVTEYFNFMLAYAKLHLLLGACLRRSSMASTLREDRAPPASLDRPEGPARSHAPRSAASAAWWLAIASAARLRPFQPAPSPPLGPAGASPTRASSCWPPMATPTA